LRYTLAVFFVTYYLFVHQVSYKRLFFALWPDEFTRQRCLSVIQAIDMPQTRAVKAINLHVTLLFLGKVDREKEQILREEASKLYAPELTLSFVKLSFWKKPGILCLSSNTNNRDLIKLVEELGRIAKKLAIPIEDRPYKPHVTLIREAKILTVTEFEPIIWRSNSFCLVESSVNDHQINYNVLERWQLK
jgi:2'-5' RNA ligase